MMILEALEENNFQRDNLLTFQLALKKYIMKSKKVKNQL